MKKHFGIPIWKSAPIVRLLLPLAIGIIFQWYSTISIITLVTFALVLLLLYFLISLFSISRQYFLQPFRGVMLNGIIFLLGAFIVYKSDVRMQANWYGNYVQDSSTIVVTINEPLIEKTKTFKAEVNVDYITNGQKPQSTSGKMLVYFSKDSMNKINLHYGDRIVFRKKLQPIKNSGNPGAFNYERYAAFQGLFHSVFLQNNDWQKLNGTASSSFMSFIYTARENILTILRKHITAGENEVSIAEALLIGYTNDLDKDLVQAYSNTGVVHIIAISGMHLGLIYVVLVWIFARMPLIRKSKLVQAILILVALWLFSLLTGGSASVIRSAVMFTFITIGQSFDKRSSIYNSLAASAFVMLCYNPYYLWDVGFQLSYCAVVGIIIFQKPLYDLMYVRYWLPDKIWQLASVSIAAQILTFPVCLYYFHQFPNLFLFTNMLAVPLSTVILFTEIALLAVAWHDLLALWLGKICGALLWLMNEVILFFNRFSFSVTDGIAANVWSTWLLYIFLFCMAWWLLQKRSKMLLWALFFLLVYCVVIIVGKWQCYRQEKLIVYNVSKYKAIDFIEGNNYCFVGDTVLTIDGMMQNFHLKPARIFYQLRKNTAALNNLQYEYPFCVFNHHSILMYDGSFDITEAGIPLNVDWIIVSGNPKLRISDLVKKVNCKKIIFDSSNSLWKIEKWEKECDELILPYHSTSKQGAFVADVSV